MSWSSSGSVALSAALMMHRWTESTISSECLDGGGVEDKRSSRALEIIRQLSFGPPRRIRKRADTADSVYGDSTSIGLLDPQRRDSLLGLQYDETCLQ